MKLAVVTRAKPTNIIYLIHILNLYINNKYLIGRFNCEAYYSMISTFRIEWHELILSIIITFSFELQKLRWIYLL